MNTDVELLSEGQLLDGRFRVLDLIGRGATGCVFRAVDQLMQDTEVALKVLYPHIATDTRALARFRKEVTAARALRHRGIVETFELRILGDALTFVVMELVPGQSLEALIAESSPEPVPLARAVMILSDIAEALEHAHSSGIVHRDLKPANVLIGRDGTSRLADFGLARLLEDESGLTRTGESLGTPHYMSPEQFRGQRATPSADVYSFGILAFELLTGARPFPGESYYTVAVSHMTEPLPFESLAIPSIPSALASMVQESTRKEPQDRPASFKRICSMLHDLREQLSGEVIQVRPRATNRPTSPYVKRERWRKGMKRVLLASSIVGFLLVALRNLVAIDVDAYSIAVSKVLRAETAVGFRLAPVRALLGMTAELDRPELLLELVRLSVESKKPTAEIRGMLNAGFDPNMAVDGQPVFLRACQEGNPVIVRYFAAAGVNLELSDPVSGQACLHRAVSVGDTLRVEIIADIGSSPTQADHHGDTFLHTWSRRGDFRAFNGDGKTWAWMRPALSVRNNDGLTPLELASKSGQPEKVRFLISLSADPRDIGPRDQNSGEN